MGVVTKPVELPPIAVEIKCPPRNLRFDFKDGASDGGILAKYKFFVAFESSDGRELDTVPLNVGPSGQAIIIGRCLNPKAGHLTVFGQYQSGGARDGSEPRPRETIHRRIYYRTNVSGQYLMFNVSAKTSAVSDKTESLTTTTTDNPTGLTLGAEAGLPPELAKKLNLKGDIRYTKAGGPTVTEHKTTRAQKEYSVTGLAVKQVSVTDTEARPQPKHSIKHTR
jgi:hypothetical protein